MWGAVTGGESAKLSLFARQAGRRISRVAEQIWEVSMLLSAVFGAGVYMIEVLTRPGLGRAGLGQGVLETVLRNKELAAGLYGDIMGFGMLWSLAALLIFWALWDKDNES